jgi:hypothetical protein
MKTQSAVLPAALYRRESNMLEDLGNLGDFIGGIAVVITLIYLALQIRHNTNAVKTASRQDVTNGHREYNRLGLEPGVMAAMVAGMRRYPDLASEQKWKFSTMINDQAHHLESAFALFEAGGLKEDIYDAYLDYFCAVIATPGGAALWSEISPLHIASLVSSVNARLSRGDIPNLLDLAVFAEPSASELHDKV